jgi:hypothetical protein
VLAKHRQERTALAENEPRVEKQNARNQTRGPQSLPDGAGLCEDADAALPREHAEACLPPSLLLVRDNDRDRGRIGRKGSREPPAAGANPGWSVMALARRYGETLHRPTSRLLIFSRELLPDASGVGWLPRPR